MSAPRLVTPDSIVQLILGSEIHQIDRDVGQLAAWLRANPAPAVKPSGGLNAVELAFLVTETADSRGYGHVSKTKHGNEVFAVHGAQFDLDKGTLADMKTTATAMNAAGLGSVMWMSHSATADAPAGRMVVLYDSPCPPDEHERVYLQLVSELCPWAPTASQLNFNRGWNRPRAGARIAFQPGALVDWRAVLARAPAPTQKPAPLKVPVLSAPMIVPDPTASAIDAWVEAFPKESGKRNVCFAFGGWACRKGVPLEQASDFIAAVLARIPSVESVADGVTSVAESYARLAAGTAHVWGVPKLRECGMGAALDLLELEWFPPSAEVGNGILDDLHIGSDNEMADILLRTEWPGAVFCEGSLWRPTAEGLWAEVAEGEVFYAARRFDGETYPTPDGKQGNVKINAGRQTSIYRTLCNAVRKPDWFAGAPVGVAFLDTFVGQSGPEKLTLDHRCRARFPFPYQSSPAPAPLFRRLLVDSLTPADGDASEGAAKARCMLEYVGRCMLGAGSKEQCAIMCIGEGNNGKSQLLEVFGGCMPAGTVCSVDPSDMGNDQARLGLVGARLNLVFEISEKEIFKTGQFKKVVSGESFKVKVVYKQPFDCVAIAGHIFACNALPQSDDPSAGFWRRWAVIPFEREVPAERRILEFGKVILASERAQIASTIVQAGLASFVPGVSWTKPRSSIAAKQAWIDESDQVRCFAADVLEPLATDRGALRGLTVVEGPGQPKTYGHWTQLQEVYDAYRKWQEGSGTGLLGRLNFTKALRARGWATHKLEDGVRVNCKLKRVEAGWRA